MVRSDFSGTPRGGALVPTNKKERTNLLIRTLIDINDPRVKTGGGRNTALWQRARRSVMILPRLDFRPSAFFTVGGPGSAMRRGDSLTLPAGSLTGGLGGVPAPVGRFLAESWSLRMFSFFPSPLTAEGEEYWAGEWTIESGAKQSINRGLLDSFRDILLCYLPSDGPERHSLLRYIYSLCF